MSATYIFPFHTLNDSEISNFMCSITTPETAGITMSDLVQKCYKQFSLVQDSHMQDSDPDNFMQSQLNMANPQCCYYPSNTLSNILNGYSESEFKIMCHNINSVPLKFDEFREECGMFFEEKFDVIAFCETKLTDDIQHLYCHPYYKYVTNNLSRNRGGLSMYIRSHHNSIPRPDITYQNPYVETLFVEIKKPQRNITVGIIYRRPHTNMEDFLATLTNILDLLQRDNTINYLMGDFNLDLLMSDSFKPVSDMITLFHSYFYYCTITHPTRVTTTTATLIDHIWTNNLPENLSNGIVHCQISDHFPIFSTFKTNNNPCSNNKTIVKSYREYTDHNIEKFKDEMVKFDWQPFYESDDPTVCFTLLHERLTSCHDKCFPLKLKNIKEHHESKPYINNEIKALIKERNKLQRKFLKKPITYGDSYRRLRNKVTQSIRSAKVNYFKVKLEKSSGDARKTWSVINTILFRKPNIEANNIDISCNSFNHYFVNIAQSLSDNIAQTNTRYDSYLTEKNDNILTFRKVTVNETLNIINSFRDSSPGHDNLPMMLIKKASSVLSSLLTHVCNTSLTDGIFPDPMKVAKIIPIHKSGPTSQVNNYRPISILPSLSKILEKIAYQQLMEFFNHNNLLTNSQYGFRPQRSTESALQCFTDHVLDAFDNDRFTLSVFLDLSKAFDTVDHSILLNKMYYYGVRGHSYQWFESYLSNRSQYVYMNSGTSTKLNINCGVPQGSILGPLLFLIFVNDIVNSSKILNYILFADDTNTYLSHSNIYTLINTVNTELTHIATWLCANKLTLNIKKTNFMILHRHKKIMYPLPPLIMNDYVLVEVSETKFLGVTIQKHLYWHRHIKNIRDKIAKQCGVMYLTRDFLNTKSLLLIYYSLIYSNLIYCHTVWGAASREAMTPLITIQKRVIRTIERLKKRDHTNDSFYKNKILKLSDINIVVCATFVYKCLNGLIPNNNRFAPNVNQRYQTRNRLNLRLPFVTSSQSHSGIVYHGAKVYNSIPNDIKNKTSVNCFKSTLKKHLIASYNAVN